MPVEYNEETGEYVFLGDNLVRRDYRYRGDVCEWEYEEPLDVDIKCINGTVEPMFRELAGIATRFLEEHQEIRSVELWPKSTPAFGAMFTTVLGKGVSLTCIRTPDSDLDLLDERA